jgi:hypothetical protein
MTLGICVVVLYRVERNLGSALVDRVRGVGATGVLVWGRASVGVLDVKQRKGSNCDVQNSQRRYVGTQKISDKLKVSVL